MVNDKPEQEPPNGWKSNTKDTTTELYRPASPKTTPPPQPTSQSSANPRNQPQKKLQ